MIKAKVPLETQPRNRLGRIRDWNAFLGFDRLMHSLAPGALRHRSARELVNDHNLFLRDHVLAVAQEKLPSGESLADEFQAALRAAPDAGKRRAAVFELLQAGL